MSGTPLLRAEALAVDLGGRRVLHDIDLAIEPGEIVTVVGPNGSGKSTLLRALIGALPPASGRVVRRPDLRIGYVPQRLAIDATMPMTVARLLSLAGARRDEAGRLLDRSGVPGLGGRQLSALSGGQMQRVLLARALAASPGLLILDEPAQALDQPGTARLYLTIEEVRAETGAAVLMVSHDLHVVMSASDRVICLNGHICCEGTPETVASAPEWRALFGEGTRGALALYRHAHDHSHDHAGARDG